MSSLPTQIFVTNTPSPDPSVIGKFLIKIFPIVTIISVAEIDFQSAIVSFESFEDAYEVFKKLDGFEFYSKLLNVEYFPTPSRATWKKIRQQKTNTKKSLPKIDLKSKDSFPPLTPFSIDEDMFKMDDDDELLLRQSVERFNDFGEEEDWFPSSPATVNDQIPTMFFETSIPVNISSSQSTSKLSGSLSSLDISPTVSYRSNLEDSRFDSEQLSISFPPPNSSGMDFLFSVRDTSSTRSVSLGGKKMRFALSDSRAVGSPPAGFSCWL